MKRLFILMLALISFGVGNAQINFTKLMEHKEQKSDLQGYEYYLNKSTKFQAGAIGSAAVAVGCFVGYACQDEKFEFKGNSDKLKMKDTPKYLLIGGSLAAASAIICELIAIDCKLQSGKHLKMHLNAMGAEISLKF